MNRLNKTDSNHKYIKNKKKVEMNFLSERFVLIMICL